MSYDTIPGVAQFPVSLATSVEQGNSERTKTELDQQMDKLNATLDVTETKKTFSSILTLMTKSTIELSDKIDQKLSN